MENSLANQNLEKYIIKCMYNSPSSITEIVQVLRGNDFYNLHYKYLFNAMKNIALDGDISAEGIMQYLQLKNENAYDIMKKAGGAIQIEKTFRDPTIPRNPSLEEPLKKLKELTYRREAVDVAEKIKNYATYNQDVESERPFEDIEMMDEKIKEAVYKLADNFSNSKQIEQIGDSVDALKAEIATGGTVGIDISGIGYGRLNRIVKRLRDGALYVIGAPEKVGKSSIMLDISWRIANELNIPVAYGDTEMTTPETLLRIVSKMSGIEEDKIADNLLSDYEQKVVNANFEKIKQVPFFHFNTNEMTNAELESKVKSLQLKHGIRLFVYDYVKIQSHESSSGRPDLVLASKIDTLKEKICKQCNIPVITSGQMYPRNTNDERGKYNKFCETSHFTKLADVILRLDRVTENDPDLFGTHYIEVITGRKIKNIDIGKRICYNFKMETHTIEEVGLVSP